MELSNYEKKTLSPGARRVRQIVEEGKAEKVKHKSLAEAEDAVAREPQDLKNRIKEFLDNFYQSQEFKEFEKKSKEAPNSIEAFNKASEIGEKIEGFRTRAKELGVELEDNLNKGLDAAKQIITGLMIK
jgi:hypothetical protein